MLQFKAESYTGKSYNSNPYMHRRGVQIVCFDSETGKRRAIFKTARGHSPCYKMAEWACHYRTGMNKYDSQRFAETMQEAEKLAEEWNKNGKADV
jgi:hypothetical protein